MGYVSRGLDFVYGDSGYIEACRFAKDTMHTLTAAALVGAGVVEVKVDEPKNTLIAAGLLGASALLEGMAWLSKQNIKNEQYHAARMQTPETSP